MKLYVEEQDMPQNCAECKAEGHYENSYGDEYGFFCPFGYKAYTSETRELKRLDNCPLVPVPEHGRLIDADALVRELTSIRASFGSANGLVEGGLNIAVSTVNGRSTIIPASEEGEK